MSIDDVINQVSEEWATGNWTSIVIAIGESGNHDLGFAPCANRWRNGLENGEARRFLEEALEYGYLLVGIIAVKDGKQHLLPLEGSGFIVGKDPNGDECFERKKAWSGKVSQFN
jgi:hypothetical protein